MGSVKFGNIEIREYALTVGDNPSCSKAPISLSWDYNPVHKNYTIDEYERHHPHHNKAKRWDEVNRHQILLNFNVPISEIMEASEECRLIQRQRQETIYSELPTKLSGGNEELVHVEVWPV